MCPLTALSGAMQKLPTVNVIIITAIATPSFQRRLRIGARRGALGSVGICTLEYRFELGGMSKTRITKPEIRMNDEIRMTKLRGSSAFGLRHSSFIRISGFVIRIYVR